MHKDIKPSCVKTSEDNIFSVENSKVDRKVEMINVKKKISDTEEILGTKEEEIKKREDVEAIKEVNDAEIIKELKDVEANLKLENATLKQQVEKLQRVATNMYKELKEMKS